MKPIIVFAMVAGVVAALVLLYFLAVWLISRSAGVRQAELKRVTAERDLAVGAVNEIDVKTDLYRDYRDPNSILATEIRDIIRTYHTERMDNLPR